MNQKPGYSKYDYQNIITGDSRNGYRKKTVTLSLVEIKLDIPRNRKGEFDPLVEKRTQLIFSNIEYQVLSMYANNDQGHLEDLM